ncbi:hypothetical protein FA95DRAFT_1308137 [Auriscalpium vulgare]|uniref:Uncharacterized protein n=1 Tax=Auriscalpium vulgare TaxID=40419 RepID=A0ACB8RTK9_9AGAM|nr:hypothetical protein FA95DRAFT_1308137 [Auriscalpium vulgare]
MDAWLHLSSSHACGLHMLGLIVLPPWRTRSCVRFSYCLRHPRPPFLRARTQTARPNSPPNLHCQLHARKRRPHRTFPSPIRRHHIEFGNVLVLSIPRIRTYGVVNDLVYSPSPPINVHCRKFSTSWPCSSSTSWLGGTCSRPKSVCNVLVMPNPVSPAALEHTAPSQHHDCLDLG